MKALREYNTIWDAKHREAHNRRQVIRRAVDPSYRLKRIVYKAARRARLLHVGGTFTVEEWVELKTRYSHTCLLCGRSEPDIKLTADHVLPLTLGGPNTIDNIQPLCVSCNCSKYTKHADYR